MADAENVITHLMIVHTWAEFARERDLQFFTPNHLKNIAEWADDAISLLKEQEPKTATDIQLSRDGFIFGGCPKCKALITHIDHKKYCGYCGQAVKWE